MNLHNLIAGTNITNGELEAKVSRMIGNILLASFALNAILIHRVCKENEHRSK